MDWNGGREGGIGGLEGGCWRRVGRGKVMRWDGMRWDEGMVLCGVIGWMDGAVKFWLLVSGYVRRFLG